MMKTTSSRSPGSFASRLPGKARILRRLASPLLLALSLSGILPSLAGEMNLSWDPVPDQGLTGYRIFYTDAPGGPFDNFVDVDLSPQQTLAGLADCTYYYVSVRSRRADGTLSAGSSNIVEGFPHPELYSASLPTIGRGGTTRVAVSGSGIVPGAILEPGSSRVFVRSLSVESCDRLTVDLDVAEDAPPGPFPLTVTNPDHGFITREDLLRIGEQPAPFEVLSVSPVAGDRTVDPVTPIRITFTRLVDAESMTASVLQLIPSGSSRPLALDAPPLVEGSGSSVSLIPAAPLLPGRSYFARIKGGPNGARAASGAALLRTVTQAPTFSVRSLFVQSLHAATDGSNPEELAGAEPVAADSRILATFSEPLDPATVTAASARILVPDRGPIRLSGSGNPMLSEDGQTIALVPGEPLPTGKTLVLQIRGGAGGVRSARGVLLGSRRVRVRFSAVPAALQSLAAAE